MSRSVLKLRYLIGKDADPGTDDSITVIGYDATTPPKNGVKYVNLLDEKKTWSYGPHVYSDTGAKFKEPAPDPEYDGFWVNLRTQLDRAKSQGFSAVELDNLDTYTASVALLCFNDAQERGLKIFVKNPLLVDGNYAALMQHPAACGAIVEPGAGAPAQMQAIRNGHPVYFVSGDYEDASLSFPDLASTGAPMADPAWLAEARASIGKYFDSDAPKLAREVAAKYPDMESYAAQATTKTPWCGTFFAAMMARAGIQPPYDKDNVDTDDFMWADAPLEAKWGTIVSRSEAKSGDVIVMRTPHHITFFDGNNGSNSFFGIGGNQGNAVTRASFSWDGVRAVVRPPTGAPVPVSNRFTACLARVLKHEGGNDDDPRDPGGRTSRGITAERWAEWRKTHPGLPEDVWQAPQAEVEAIYKAKYWDVLWCDQLPPGVDYAVFDFGVNSGPARSAKFLQEIVGSEADGEVGPNTVAATKASDPEEVINALCDNRMYFLKGLKGWPTFGNGWTNRVNDVRRDALADVGTVDEPDDEPEPTAKSIDEALARIDAAVADIRRLADVATQAPQMDWGKILQPILAELAPKILPMLMPLIVQMLPQLLPYILGNLFQPRQSVVSSNAKMGASAVGGGLLVALADHFLTK